jgi:hypothetical protein
MKKRQDLAQRSQRTQRRREREKEEALEGDYMDYEITWIKAHMILLIHVIS